MNSPFPVLAVLSLATLFGCASTGTDRSAAAHDSAETLREEYGRLKEQIDKTVEALAAVGKKKDSNELKGAYDNYVRELNQLEKQGKRVVSASSDLRQDTQKYISGWEKQMASVQSADLRKHAEERRKAAAAQFEEARDELDQIEANYKKFFDRLRDIKVVLENDLNAAGVAGLEGTMAKVPEEAEPVKKDIDGIMAGLAKVATALSTQAEEATKKDGEKK